MEKITMYDISEYRPSSARTPWGKAQYSRRIAPGIVFYCTSGHGGIHVSKNAAWRLLSQYTYDHALARGNHLWYEEDCKAFLVLKDLTFTPGMRDLVERMFCIESVEDNVRRWHPDYPEVFVPAAIQ